MLPDLSNLPEMDKLPRRSVSEVMYEWHDTLKKVREEGGVAITIADSVEFVIVDAHVYKQMARIAAAAKKRQLAVLDVKVQ